MPKENLKFAFFGSSRFSEFVLDELKKARFEPMLSVTDAKAPLPPIEDAKICVVASFGKILPADYLQIPKHGFINVHPSMLPRLRGPSPIQNIILQNEEVGITIIKMDEKMDHGPILAQEKISLNPFPDHYAIVEERLARAGGRLLVEVLPKWVKGEIEAAPQDDSAATYVKMVKKEDGLINLEDKPEINLRKILAYSAWPQAYFFFVTKTSKKLRIVVRDAKIEDGKLMLKRIVPEGKREMDWQDFLRGNA